MSDMTMEAAPFLGRAISAIAVVAASAAVGRELGTANYLDIDFEGGGRLRLWDDGRSCCEHRYMSAEDDLAGCVGGKLVGIELRDGPHPEEEGDVHECEFLHVITDRMTAVISNHNEHNGYYGGFCIRAEAKGQDDGPI